MPTLRWSHSRAHYAAHVLAFVVSLSATAAARGDDIRAAYERAERFLPAQAAKLVLNVTVEPVWIDATDRFIYRRQLANERKEFLLVDAAANMVVPAFDHARLAAALPSPSRTRCHSSA